MSNQITSRVLGLLTQDKTFSDWWVSNIVEIPFFDNTKLPITFSGCDPETDKIFIEEADEALTNFLQLNSFDRNSVSDLACKLCMDFFAEIEPEESDEQFKQLKNKNEIWKFVHPTEIFVTRRPFREKDLYVQISCQCDWEPEHELQLVFRQGRKVTRISYFDGHLTEADTYGKPDEEDELLSRF